jgi:hypothetical protein
MIPDQDLTIISLIYNNFNLFQLFILIASLPGNSAVPVAFGLLPNKTASTYSQFLRIIGSLSDDIFKSKNSVFVFLKKKHYN